MNRRIPNNLRKYRKAIGLSQKEVAKKLGIKNASQISRWEKGVCLPGSLNIFRLAVLYRRMADSLFIQLRKAIEEELRSKGERA